MTYPVACPTIGEVEMDAVRRELLAGNVSQKGGAVERFEKAFASRMGSRYAVAVSSGTIGLQMALEALNIGEGDEVIVPDFTMIATARAVTAVGAKPVFVDCGPDLNINVDAIKAAITPSTWGIMPVHIYGRPCDMRPIMEIAREAKLNVIEDAAEAHGATYEGRCVGTFGDMGVFSLFANKIITTGLGGIIITDKIELAEELRRIRSLYFTPDHNFVHQKLGHNANMTSMQAAIGEVQLERLDFFLTQRDKIADWYDQKLAKYRTAKRRDSDVLWMYDVVLPPLTSHNAERRDRVMEFLAKQGIETRRFFVPMTMQPMYLDGGGENAKAYSERGFYLPTYIGLTESDCDFISDAFLKALKQA